MIRASLFFVLFGMCVTGRAASQEYKTEPGFGKKVFVAHRGGIVPGYPENTLAAYRRAMECGVDAIEIDLRETRDGGIVIMHDETVDRTTNGRGKVADLTMEELGKLDAGGGERIPSFEDVLKLVAGTRVNLLLDIKEGRSLDKEKVVRLIERHHAVLNVIVGPRSLEDLRAFHALNPNLRTLGFVPNAAAIDAFIGEGVDIIRLWPDWLRTDPGLVQRVHARGRPVWVTAGDAPFGELEKMTALGIDGVLSDFPDMMRERPAGGK